MENLKRFAKYLLISAMGFIFIGCSANYHSIYRTTDLSSSDNITSIDAKQKAIISSKKDSEIRKFCLEPNPDVFTVISHAFSGEATFGKEASPEALNVALAATLSSSETGSTITRTQTINMLKEMMYRTCERYLNGAITELEMSIVSARDQRIMTSILAIEQLTGTVTPKPTVISITGNSSIGKINNENINSFVEAKNKMDIAQVNYNKAKEKTKDIANCDELIKSDKPEDKDNKLKCENEISTKKVLDSEVAYYKKISELVSKASSLNTSSTGTLLSSHETTTVDKELEELRLSTVQQVSTDVKEIVLSSFKKEDETSFFCYKVIQTTEVISDEIKKQCMAFLVAKTKVETEEFNNALELMERKIEGKKRKKFKEFIKNVSPNNTLDSKDLISFLDEILKDINKITREEEDIIKEMKTKKEKEDLYDLFKRLDTGTRDRLSKARKESI